MIFALTRWRMLSLTAKRDWRADIWLDVKLFKLFLTSININTIKDPLCPKRQCGVSDAVLGEPSISGMRWLRSYHQHHKDQSQSPAWPWQDFSEATHHSEEIQPQGTEQFAYLEINNRVLPMVDRINVRSDLVYIAVVLSTLFYDSETSTSYVKQPIPHDRADSIRCLLYSR